MSPVPSLGWPGTKNGASHRVWLPAPVQALLAEIGDEAAAGFVFAGPRGRHARLDCRHAPRSAPSSVSNTQPSTISDGPSARPSQAWASVGDGLNRVTNRKEGGIASVFDRHGYAEENKKMMEATAARIHVFGRGANKRRRRSDAASIIVKLKLSLTAFI